MIKIQYRHKEATECKKFYGGCYIDHSRSEHVCYPIPLNYIIRIILHIWWELKSPRYFDLSKRDHEILTEIRVRRRLIEEYNQNEKT